MNVVPAWVQWALEEEVEELFDTFPFLPDYCQLHKVLVGFAGVGLRFDRLDLDLVQFHRIEVAGMMSLKVGLGLD